MKKLMNIKLLIILSIFIALNCNKDSSSNDSPATFLLQPGIGKFTSPTASYNIDFIGNMNLTNVYAILYQGTVNSTDYIGIAVTDSPSAPTFKMIISFPGTTIPESGTLSTTNASVRIIKGTPPSTYTPYSADSVSFDFNISLSGETTNEAGTTTYKTYTLTTSSTPLISGQTLTITNITALKI